MNSSRVTTGSIGAMSVRAARGTTCVLDGWGTIGAGNRVRVPGPDDGLPPVPLPTVPIPEDPADPDAPQAIYAPPERDPAPDTRDVWSLGCLYLELLIWMFFGWDGLVDCRRVRRAERQRLHGCRSPFPCRR